MNWYYVSAGERVGPLSEEAMRDSVAMGRVAGETLVWRDGMENWTPFESVRGELGVPPAPPWPPPAPEFASPVSPGAEQRQCSECRRVFHPNDVISLGDRFVCANCKPALLQRIREGGSIGWGPRYAGFWIRFVARMIDGAITAVVSYIFQIPMFFVLARMGTRSSRRGGGEFDMDSLALLISAAAFAILMSLLAQCAYEAWFLVNKSATPGKLILGLQVVRTDGRPFTWGAGIGRFFAYFLSSLTLYIGFLMAAWDEEKRALHDRICDTRVVHVK
jgi:uncharacterized RDD family membrane protein YckC